MFGTVKKISKTPVAYFLLYGALGIVVSVVYVSVSRPDNVPVFNLQSRDGIERAGEFWKQQITKRDDAVAYTLFLRTYASSTPGDQHTAAHIFGSALFQTKGLAGLSTCDSSFSYGCFHEFLGRAIEAGGLGQVADLNQACYDAVGPTLSLTCTHGLGHGIQSHLGYTEDGLVASLDECSKLPYGDPIGGCPGGVFMEYNMRTMHSFTGMPIREPKEGDMLYPCDILPADYAAACYYWQPQWWQQVLLEERKTKDEAFVALGNLCRKVPISLRRECFEGVGTIVATAANFDVARAVVLCNMTTPAGELRAACLITAASVFAAEPSVKNSAQYVCGELEGDARATCVRYSSGESSQAVHEEKL